MRNRSSSTAEMQASNQAAKREPPQPRATKQPAMLKGPSNIVPFVRQRGLPGVPSITKPPSDASALAPIAELRPSQRMVSPPHPEDTTTAAAPIPVPTEGSGPVFAPGKPVARTGAASLSPYAPGRSISPTIPPETRPAAPAATGWFGHPEVTTGPTERHEPDVQVSPPSAATPATNQPAAAAVIAPTPTRPRGMTVPDATPAPAPMFQPAASIAEPFPGYGLPTPAPAMPEPASAPALGWNVYEKIGLGAPKEPFNRAKFIVNVYRSLGFAILSIIVVVLVGYIATNIFYATSSRWIQPMVISPTDERVLALASKAADQETERDRLAAELAQAERVIESQQAFQGQFAEAIRADLRDRQATLAKVKELASQYAGANARSRRSNNAYAAASKARMSREYRAGLIDNSTMLSGNYQVAQIQTNTLSLAERQTEYETRSAKLEAEAKALDGILSGNASNVALSFDILRVKQEFETSRLQTARLLAERKNLQAALERQEKLLANMQASPYLRAAQANANIAFVPYDNLSKAVVGEPLYSCWLEMMFCRKVGTVKAILPGEVSMKHPIRSGHLRGQMIEMQLTHGYAATKDTLFVGRRPLLL